MKRFILLGIALALSWSSCRDSALSELGDPDGAAMSFTASDGMTDPVSAKSEPEQVLAHHMTMLINGLYSEFDSWSDEDLQAITTDEGFAHHFSEEYFASASHHTLLADVVAAISFLTETHGQGTVERVIHETVSGIYPIGPLDDSQSVDTPCYDKFQTKADLAGVALGACVAATAATVAGPTVCLAVYTATMSIYLREFYRCVTEN